MKIAVTSTVLFEVSEQPLDQIVRDFRRANEIALGTPLRTVTGQLYVMLAIESFEVVTRPPSFTCPRCGRRSYDPHDVAQHYCGACHRFLDS